MPFAGLFAAVNLVRKAKGDGAILNMDLSVVGPDRGSGKWHQFDGSSSSISVIGLVDTLLQQYAPVSDMLR